MEYLDVAQEHVAGSACHFDRFQHDTVEVVYLIEELAVRFIGGATAPQLVEPSILLEESAPTHAVPAAMLARQGSGMALHKAV